MTGALVCLLTFVQKPLRASLHALECMLTLIIRKGWTAVHWAAEQNQPACIRALLDMMADVNIHDM